MLARNKNSSIFGPFVSDEEKERFITLTPGQLHLQVVLLSFQAFDLVGILSEMLNNKLERLTSD